MFVDKLNFLKLFNSYIESSIPFLFIIDFDLKNFFISTMEELQKEDIIFNFSGTSSCKNTKILKEIQLEIKPITYNVYLESFLKVKKHLENGDSYLVNLTFPTTIFTNLTLEEIFYKSKAPYKLKFKDKFVFFSPETFVKISGNFIYTYPMKGTIDASVPNAKYLILEDEKEFAEHLTIVDLLRNDLNTVCEYVWVNKFRFISSIVSNGKKLFQVSSEIIGKLKQKRLAQTLLSLLPAGSISGAPKRKTLDIIKETEIYERGFYTGVAGVFNGSTIDSCTMIRFIEKKKNNFIYKSGGGITVYSDPSKEYSELLKKIYVPTG